MVLLSRSCHCGLVIVAIVIIVIVSIIISIAFVVTVIINRCCHHCLHYRLLFWLWWRSNGNAAIGAVMAEKVVAQGWQWRCSNGIDNAVSAMAVQQQLRQRSNRNGGAATA